MRQLSLLVLFLVAALASTAFAQEVITGQPMVGSATSEEFDTLTGEAPPVEPFRILVVGDALAGGLGGGLQRMTAEREDVEISVRANEASGIARPEVYDWAKTLPKIFASRQYDAVVVLIGANDRQAIRAGDLRHEFNSPEWLAAYRQRLGGILGTLLVSGSRIYWVSLPPMADAKYEEAMRIVLDLQRKEVEARGGIFIDIRPAFTTADGAFTAMGPDETGEVKKLRSSDGIGFFKRGNNRMAQLVFAAVTGAGAAAPKTARKAPLTGEQISPEKPLFGQTAADGIDITFRPEDFSLATLGAGAASVLASIVAPGSDAEKLFVTGEAPPPPTGRADDYMLPVQ